MLDSNTNSNNKAQYSAQHNTQLKVLLNLLISFFFIITSNKLFSSRLIYFLTILGINSNINYLYIVKNYLYILAGVVYYIRVLSVEKLLLSTCYNKQTNKNYKYFLEYREKYLANSLYSLISKVLSLLAYSKYIMLAASNLGNIYQLKNKKIFYLYSCQIYISCFYKIVQDIVSKVEQMLQEELFQVIRVEEQFTIKLDTLINNIIFKQQGVSFIQYYNNSFKNKLEQILIQAKQIEQSCRLQLSNRQQNIKQVKQYLRYIDYFLILLIVYIYIISRQLGKELEIIIIQYCNRLLQDYNIFIIDRQVIIVIYYYKLQLQQDKLKVVLRFLLLQLRQVIVLYLVYLQLFCKYLTIQVLSSSFSNYVQVDKQSLQGTN